jgi:hypothetical protein
MREPSAVIDMKLVNLFPLISSSARSLAGYLKGITESQKINIFRWG